LLFFELRVIYVYLNKGLNDTQLEGIPAR